MLKKLEIMFDNFSKVIGAITAFVLVLMIFNVFYDVIMRYFFNQGSIAMQELEWHLFSVVILLGMSYTLQQDGHVRVDVIYDNLSKRKQAMINIFGIILFIFPVAIIIGYDAIAPVIEAYNSNEQSGDPGGLTNRWIVKSLIPTCFVFLIISATGYLIRQINILKGEQA